MGNKKQCPMVDCSKFRFIEWTSSFALEQQKQTDEKGESDSL